MGKTNAALTNSASSHSLLSVAKNCNSDVLIHASVADELILNAGKLSVFAFVVILLLIYTCTPNDEIMQLKKSEQDAAKIAFWMMSLR